MIVSALAALAGAVARNVTAAALLGSFVFSTALCRLGVPFNFVLWVLIDLAVIVLAVRPDMRRRDLVILALFAPIWALYIAQPAWWSQAVIVLVCVQMLLTFPIRRLGLPALRAWVRFNKDCDLWRDGDLKAYA